MKFKHLMTRKEINKFVLAVVIFNLFQLTRCESILEKSLTNDDQVCKLVRDKLVCSKITDKCPQQACLQLKEINYDTSVTVINSNSFLNYKIDDMLTINFNNLKRIETDAFSGLVLNENAHLNINIINDENKPFDSSKNNNNSNNSTTEESTKSKMNLIIETNAFRDLLVSTSAKLTIQIKNFDLVEFKSDSILNQFKQNEQSLVEVSIDASKHVVFRGDSTNTKRLLNKISNPSSLTQFKLNINKCSEIAFDKESISNYKQTPFSTFQLEATDFDNCRLGRLSFSQLAQSQSSSFVIKLTGKRLTLSEQAFSSLEQNQNSQLFLYLNITESNVCLKSNTFGDIKQGVNSTILVSFNLREQNDIILKQDAIKNLNQSVSSRFQLYVIKPNDVRLESQSITNLNQGKLSVFEIWVSKADGNFNIDQNAFNKIKQSKNALIKFGYQSSAGFFYQSPNSFFNFVSESNSQVVYDISSGTNFNLRFSPRPMPRIMPLITSNMSIEEAIYRMFPNLGRQSRPDQITLNDYKLESNDFCRISEIPFDVLVKLRPDTDCSCSVYFLYRLIRRVSNRTDWIQFTPECYQNKINQLKDATSMSNIGLNDQKDIKTLENMCNFKELVNNCRLTAMNLNQNKSKIDTSSLRDCDSSFEYFESDQLKTNDETYVYDIGSETDTIIDDDSEELDGEDDGDEDEYYSTTKNDNSVYGKFSYDDDRIVYDEGDGDDGDDGIEEFNDYDENDSDYDENSKEITNDKKLIRPTKIYKEIISNDVSTRAQDGMKLSTIHIIFVVIFSMILISILIAVFIVFRISKREQSLSQNDNDDDSSEDENDDYNDDDNEGLVPNKKSNRSIFEPIKKKYEKQKKKINLFPKQSSNSRLPAPNLNENERLNKNLLVQCDRKNSITSSLTSTDSYKSDDQQQQSVISNLIISEQNESNSGKKEKRIYNNQDVDLNKTHKQLQTSHSALETRIKHNYDIHN